MWTWNSDPFGTDAANPNPAGVGTFPYNLRFPGQLFDGQAGLHQNYFRDLDPATARYTKSDPIGLRGGINTYAYAEADPINSSDPFGLEIGPAYHAIYKMDLVTPKEQCEDCEGSDRIQVRLSDSACSDSDATCFLAM